MIEDYILYDAMMLDEIPFPLFHMMPMTMDRAALITILVVFSVHFLLGPDRICCSMTNCVCNPILLIVQGDKNASLM